MKCPECEEGMVTIYSSIHPRRVRCQNPRCYHGWMAFWTPAERAGLKAMGSDLKMYRKIWRMHNELYLEINGTAAIESIIHNYIRAARKTKED